ncbi:DUF374 domain-containing protein [Candidatus Dependentiae bacterium]|nr:DUF374 domain-containing protein [Candidatus Dependentiae bacterium]
MTKYFIAFLFKIKHFFNIGRNLKKFIKRIKNSEFLSYLTCCCIYFYLKILFATYRIQIKLDHDYKDDFNHNVGVFYFWHQNIIAATYFFFKKKCVGHCIISPSRDGKIMGFLAQKFGFKVIYGSAYKKSVEVIRRALDVIDVNKRLAIVGDGSRGPAFKLQRGTIYLAAKSQVPLIYVECKSEWVFTFKKSWDHFQIPLPFSKIYIRIHAPVIPSQNAYKNF